jgi:hypothetical protein
MMRGLVLYSFVALSLCAGCYSALVAQPNQSPPSRVEVWLKSDPGNPWLEWVKPSTLLGFVGGLGGIVGMLIQRSWQRRDEEKAAQRAERDRLQAHVLDSLKWFEGRTQKRSIGIAVIEGNWSLFTALQPTWIAILVNQAVYLLAQSRETEDAALEQQNLKRIMDLLLLARTKVAEAQKKGLSDALGENLAGRGLRGMTEDEIQKWHQAFSVPGDGS